MITLKEALEDLHDRMTKQLGEKIWEIERVKGIKDKSPASCGVSLSFSIKRVLVNSPTKI